MTVALVLGSTGCIGNNIVRACLAEGWEVRAFRRGTSPTWMLDGLDVQQVIGDLSDPDSLVGAMRGCDTVFHAAAHYPRHSLDMEASLRAGTSEMRRVMAAASAAGVGRLVYTSSLTTIGRSATPGRLSDEDDYYLPGSTGSAYFEAKWLMEAEAWRSAAAGAPIVIVNPTVVFGPWDVKPTTGRILVDIARGRLPVWLDLEVNVVDARDVGRGHLLAATRGQVGERYILGGENVGLRQALTFVAEQAGVKPPRWRTSAKLLTTLARLGEVAGRLPMVKPLPLEHLKTIGEWKAVSVGKARRQLGFEPRPFAATVVDSLAWFREYGYL